MTERILITGAAGFFASHFVEHLLANTDWEIVGMVRTSKVGWLRRLFDQEGYDPERVKLVHHDFRWAIPGYVKADIGPVDYIAHVGGETHVDWSIENPLEFVQSNVLGTANMLEYARLLKKDGCLRKFNYFSTDEVYGPAPDGVLHTETFPYNATNPYAATKAGAEQLVNAFGNCYDIPVFTTSTMNLIGEKQHSSKFVPSTMRKVINGETVIIHSDATKTRSGSRFYIHCRNAAAALLFLFERAEQRGRYNIVGEKEVTNLELAQFIADEIGLPLKYEMVDWHSSRPGHDSRYALSGEKLAAMGFVLPSSFENSLRKTIQWTLRNPSWLIP